jgi:phage N-6-adenine-methyltransferase
MQNRIVVNNSEENPRNCWRTPRELFERLHDIFDFTVDAAASRENALLRRFWTRQQDASLQDWRNERVFCNPPFAGIEKFLAKAPDAEVAVFVYLLNALTTRAFHHAPPGYILIPDLRIRFTPPPEVEETAPTLGTCLLIYGRVTRLQSRQLNHLRLPQLQRATGWLKFKIA